VGAVRAVSPEVERELQIVVDVQPMAGCGSTEPRERVGPKSDRRSEQRGSPAVDLQGSVSASWRATAYRTIAGANPLAPLFCIRELSAARRSTMDA
jgi:hypothetical protein